MTSIFEKAATRLAQFLARTSKGRVIATATAVLAAAMVLIVLIDTAINPWARSLTGGPTLTGEWFGRMTTPTGAKHLVWIEIYHEVPGSDCTNCPSILGSAGTCRANEKIHHYEVWGGVENWSGTQFHLKMRETEESEVHLNYLEGKWNGDQVNATTTLVAPDTPTTIGSERNEAGEEITTVIGGHPDTRAPITFSLGRGTLGDFEALCKAGAS
jgi:hypothetical protein